LRFLSMPLDQAAWLPLIDVCDYGEVLHLAAVGKQILLTVANPNREIAQRFRVLLLALFPRHKIHLGAFTDLFRMRLAVELPRRFVQLLNRLMQRHAHPRADREPNRTMRHRPGKAGADLRPLSAGRRLGLARAGRHRAGAGPLPQYCRTAPGPHLGRKHARQRQPLPVHAARRGPGGHHSIGNPARMTAARYASFKTLTECARRGERPGKPRPWVPADWRS